MKKVDNLEKSVAHFAWNNEALLCIYESNSTRVFSICDTLKEAQIFFLKPGRWH